MIFSVLLTVLVLGVQAQDQLVIKGQFKDYKPNQGSSVVELGYRNFKDKKLGSIELDKEGRFEMKLAFGEPTVYAIKYGRKRMSILADKAGTIEAIVDAQGKQTVTGSQATQDYLNYRAKHQALLSKYKVSEASRNIFAMLRKKHAESKKVKGGEERKAFEQKYAQQYHALYNKYQTQRKKALADLDTYVKDHLATSLAVFPATVDWTDNNLAYMKTIVGKFKQAHPQWRVTQFLENKLQTIVKTSVGQTAPNIALKNPQGQTIQLSSLRGKYVLIDFWASWCRPCRAENPHLVAMYNKYKPQGFTIYSVSIDDKQKPWEKAIKKDGLTWTNVSDLKGWDSETRLLYNVWGLPGNLLLDKTGKIIAKNLRGEALSQKLGELLGN